MSRARVACEKPPKRSKQIVDLGVDPAVISASYKAAGLVEPRATDAAQPSTKVKPLVATITADPKLKAAVLAALQAA